MPFNKEEKRPILAIFILKTKPFTTLALRPT
jgi:hypothetical protein